MTTLEAPKFGVKFPSRKERIVKRVTKCETREIQKRLEPPKPAPVRPPPKPKATKQAKPPATLVKPPPRPSREPLTRSTPRTASTKSALATSRTLQVSDLDKLARLNCSREFSLFHKYIKPQLPKAYENQLGFLQTKLQHLKNEFVNQQVEHLNFEQIKEYYNEAVKEHIRRKIKPDEYLTLAEKFRQDIKQAIDKWLRRKELKPPRQVTIHLQRRQQRIRNQIKETIEEQKRQKQKSTGQTESSITMTSQPPTRTVVDDDDIMIID